jgi:hypothetical protein
LRLAQSIGCLLVLLTAPWQCFANSVIGVSSGVSSSPLKQADTGDIYAQIEKSEYQIHWHDSTGAYMAPNRAQNLRFTLHDNGLTITQRKPDPAQTPWAATVILDSYGRNGFAVRGVGTASWTTAENMAQVKSDGITIAYNNDKEGLRQDFLIQEKPPGKGPLRLDFLVEAPCAKSNCYPWG